MVLDRARSVTTGQIWQQIRLRNGEGDGRMDLADFEEDAERYGEKCVGLLPNWARLAT